MTAGLSPAALLRAWEIAETRSPLDRPLVLLWAAEGAGGDAADLPLAERDRRLLAVRRASFGDAMTCLAECPACGERLEMDLSAAALAESLTVPEPQSLALGDDGQAVTLRPLDSRDLAAAAGLPADAVEDFLCRRAAGLGAPDVPDAALAQVRERLNAWQERAELRLALTCAACGESWSDVLDVAAFLWGEVAVAARRLMGEVAEIAAAFGWAEATILAMALARRRAYLEIARGT